MVNTDKLKQEIIASGYTQKSVYESIGLTRRQWNHRMSNQVFSSDEIYNICNLIGKHIMPIFFED